MRFEMVLETRGATTGIAGLLNLDTFPFALRMLVEPWFFRGFFFVHASTCLAESLVFAHLWGDKWGECSSVRGP